MYEKAKQFTLERPKLKRAVGVVLILAGIFALFLPVIPGIVLLIIGLELLGLRLLAIDRFIEKTLKKKHMSAKE